MPSIEMHVDDRQVQTMMRKLAQNGRRVPVKAMLAVGRASVDRNFQQRGRPRWKPLADSTIRSRRHGGDSPLVAHAGPHIPYLRDSVQVKVLGNNGKVFTDHPVAAFHQFGTRKSKRHPGVPKRPFMVWQDSDVPVLLAIMQKQLEQGVVR